MIRHIRKLDERGLTRETKRTVNLLIDEVKALRISRGLGYTIKHTAGGQILAIDPATLAGAGKLEVRRFQIVSVKEKYWVCGKLTDDGAGLSGSFGVTRPRETYPQDVDSYPIGLGITAVLVDSTQLRRTLTFSSGGKTFEIIQDIFPTASASSTPGFGSQIYALRNPLGGTEDDENGDKIEWIDLNRGARHWANGLQLTDMCVDVDGTPTTKSAFVNRSDVEED